MIKILHSAIVFFHCSLIFINLKLFGLKNMLDRIDKKLIFLSTFKPKRTFKIINFFYRKKIFSCLVCSIVIFTMKEEISEDLILNIGVKADSKNTIKSHAWITSQKEVIFGENLDIEKYKIIFKK